MPQQQNNNQTPVTPPAPPAPAPSFQVTGTFTGLKAPLINGVVALIDNQIYSFTAPTAQPLLSTTPPASMSPPMGLCGDMTNGIAIYSGTTVAYLTGVGIAGANWNTLPAMPAAGSNASISAMCGDLANGLVISDGSSLYSLQFNGSAPEWTLLAAPPAGTIVGIAGDPTNGVLLVMSPGSGPSSLYFGAGGCSCTWVPLSAPSTNLPVTKIQVEQVCGSAGAGFILFGENQLLTVTIKYTAATATAPAVAAAVQTKMPSPPFAVSDVAGDPTNGCTALGGASGLIANANNAFAPWTVISAMPTAAASAAQ